MTATGSGDEELWHFRDLELVWDRWIADDQPDVETQFTVGNWLMGLQRDPRPSSSGPVPAQGPLTYLGSVPGTQEVVFLYLILEHDHTLYALTLDTI